MLGRKKKDAAVTKDKNAAPEKQSQLAVLKDAYKLVRKESPAGIVYSILIFFVVLIAGIGLWQKCWASNLLRSNFITACFSYRDSSYSPVLLIPLPSHQLKVNLAPAQVF
jgi:hypothetical protein